MTWNVERKIQSFNYAQNTPEFGINLSTKREILEQSLCETKYRSIFENALVGIFQATKNGNYLMVNSTLATIYGYHSSSELIANVKNIKKQLYVDKNRYLELMRLLQENKTIKRFESQVYRRDGTIIWISENVRPIYDSKGNFLGYEGTVEDITERKLSEKIIQDELKKQRDAAESKYQFLSMVCHDLRTFLTVILTASDLLKYHNDKLKEKDREKYFSKISTTIKTMNELLEGLLVIGKTEFAKQTIQIVPFDFRGFCESIWQDVQAITKTNHQLIYSSICDNITLITDKTLLRQILMNLLLNAVKYSPESNIVYLDLNYQNNQITFKIKDEGVGIPKEEQDKLFEAFHRASNALKFAGTGLGMTIVKRAVELQGGTISVESEVGKGTTFAVTLPTICTKISTKASETKVLCCVTE